MLVSLLPDKIRADPYLLPTMAEIESAPGSGRHQLLADATQESKGLGVDFGLIEAKSVHVP
jgi:hypothetical protein